MQQTLHKLEVKSSTER